MSLFILEHKKLWRKLSVKLSVLLCFVYIVIFGSVLSYQWFTFGSSDDYTSAFGNNFDGYAVIKESQSYSERFGRELTDESLQQMVREYQRLDNAGQEEELEKTDWSIINSWLTTLWPELSNTNSYELMIGYVNPEKLTGLYERRQQAIDVFLENSGQVGAERECLLQMEEQVKKPFAYEWTNGWSQLLGSMTADLGTVMALFIAIVLSGLFAGEWHDNTKPLLLTTRNGWQKIGMAKVCTGFCFAIELFTLLATGMVLSQLFFMGTAGHDMPIQNIKMLSIAPITMLQAELYQYAFALLGSLGFAGVVMLISASVKSNVLALIASLAAVYGPMMVVEYLPYGLQKALDLLPLVGSSTDIFRTNTFNIFGKIIWSPYLLISVPFCIGMIAIPFALKKWAKRLRA